MKNKYSLALFICLILMLASCDTFRGCGPIVAIGNPKTEYKTYNNGIIRQYTYYPVVIKDDNWKRHTIYVSANTYYNAKIGDIICVE